MTNFKYEIDSIQRRLDIHTTLLENINETNESNINFNHVAEHYNDSDIICIDSIDDLNNVEDKLTNDRTFRVKIVIKLFSSILYS